MIILCSYVAQKSDKQTVKRSSYSVDWEEAYEGKI